MQKLRTSLFVEPQQRQKDHCLKIEFSQGMENFAKLCSASSRYELQIVKLHTEANTRAVESCSSIGCVCCHTVFEFQFSCV